MKLSAITLALIATGLRNFADAVDNMAEEAGNAPQLETRVADSTSATEQVDKDISAADKDDEALDDEVEETASERKSRLRKEKRAAKKAAEEKDDEDLNEEEEEGEVEETASEKKSRLRKEKRAAKKAAEKKEEEEEEDDSFLDEGEEGNDDAPTKEDVKSALVGLAKAKGNAAAKKVLTKFKAANISQIKEKDYADVMDMIDEAGE